MTDMTTPAPGQVSQDTTPVAPPVTVQDDGKQTPQDANPDGETEQIETDPTKDSTYKERRAQRNKDRWQQIKEASAYAARRATAAEAELAQLRSGRQPDFSQIADPTDELAERTAWKVKQSQAEDQVVRARGERNEQLIRTWDATVEDMRDKVPDFDTVVTAQTPIHARAAPFIIESDKGGEIAYYLGKNPSVARDLFEKFAANDPRALVELGRIEARLSAPAAKTVSTAPKPATTLNGGSNPLQFDPARSTVTDMAAQLKKQGIIR